MQHRVAFYASLNEFCFVVVFFLDMMSEYSLSLSPAICAKDRLSLNTLMQQLCDEFTFNMEKETRFHGYAVSQGFQKTVRRVVGKFNKPIVHMFLFTVFFF